MGPYLSTHIATMDDEFNVPNGDIILRTTQGSPNRDFRVHKLVLSLASPVFADMFSLPQPRSDGSGAKSPSGEVDGVEVIDVTDPPQALDLILRHIYPFVPPNVDSLDLLVEGLVVADKYNVESARAKLRAQLTKFVNEDPLRVYAIACRFGFGEEAEAASTLTTTRYLPGLADLPDDMKYVSVPAYHKLVVLHANYRDSIEDVADGVLFEPACLDCKVAKALAEPRMRTKLVRIICRGTPTTVASCIEELGIVCRGTCMVKFVEGVVAKLGDKSTIVRS